MLNQINIIKKDIRCSEKSYKSLLIDLANNISFIEKYILMSLLRKHSLKISDDVKRRHEKKLYNLWKDTNRCRIPNSLLNLSDKKLTVEEENILQYGLDHHILPPKIHHDQLKANIEKGVCSLYQNRDVECSLRDDIKYATQAFVKNGNQLCSSAQNKMYHKTLGNLARDKSIKICSFDKGSGLVILNSEDYYKKLDTIVNDRSKFSVITHEPHKPHPLIQKQNSVTYRWLR